jgi:hypothetical protein
MSVTPLDERYTAGCALNRLLEQQPFRAARLLGIACSRTPNREPVTEEIIAGCA